MECCTDSNAEAMGVQSGERVQTSGKVKVRIKQHSVASECSGIHSQ